MPATRTVRAAGPANLGPVASVSRREAVVTEIRRGIVLGALKPGERLTETALAASLEVSRATVREGLAELIREGLLVSEPYRGLRVADLDLKALHDLAATRVALDVLAARSIVGDPTGRRMEAVQAAWATFEQAIDDVDPLVRHHAHLSFHHALWTASGNAVLAQLWPAIEADMTIAMAQDEAARPSADRTRRMHHELVLALESADLDVIEDAFTHHTVTSAGELITLRARDLA